MKFSTLIEFSFNALLLLTGLPIVLATPISNYGLTSPNKLNEFPRRAPGSFYLRIMPLGASITKGVPSDPELEGRGYRKFLRDKLRSDGWKVNMVGSQFSGNGFADNDNEGWPGFIIGPEDGSGDDSVHNKAKAAVPKYKPNLVLLNCGTNDAVQNKDLDNVGNRMEAMLKTIYDSSPGVVVILSTLLPNRDNNDKIESINEQYRALVPKLLQQGYKIQLADMNDGFITLNEIFDGTHPTALGALRMASVWHLAISEVESRGDWLKEPSSDVDFQDDSNNQCPKRWKSGADDPRSGMQVLMAGSGNIKDDGNFVHTSVSKGEIISLVRIKQPFETRMRLYAAQLVSAGADRGGERDDLVWVGGDQTTVSLLENKGDGTFRSLGLVNIEGDCWSRGIKWGDVNNDGLDDFICIRPDGAMWVSINNGENPPSFKGWTKFRDGLPGYAQASVRLGDIDGDGRLDYCVIHENRDLECWRNGGLSFTGVEYWNPMGIVFTASGKGVDGRSVEEMRLVDINGDFRSDVLWVDNSGRVTTWINQRGSGQSMVPYWRAAGVTHPGMGEDVGVGGQQDNIIFGRIYSDFHTDYLRWAPAADSNSPLTAWQCTGGGGRFPKGDGAFWGDMTDTGNDDYVWIDPEGNVVVFVNKNKRPGTDLYENGAAWDDKGIVLRTGMDRKSLHIGDWDGDGRADVIGVDKKTGAMTVWLTSYSDGAFSFSKQTSNREYCTQGWGVGRYDLGVQFADISGEGCVDYLCLEPNGRITAWLNECKKPDLFDLRNVGQVKRAEPLGIGNIDRANIRYADINGDGKADFLWVDRTTGDGTAWVNLGERPESERASLFGSIFSYSSDGKVYGGADRGPNTHYPNLGGVGRADMVWIDPTTAHGWVSFNSCPNGGGDDGPVPPRDYELPFYSYIPVCPVPLCLSQDSDWGCGLDPYADDFSDEDLCDETPIEVRSHSDTQNQNSTSIAAREAYSLIEPRGKKRSFEIEWTVLAVAWALIVYSRAYPGATHLHDPTRSTPASNVAFRMSNGCTNTNVQAILRTTLTSQQLQLGYDTEHNPDLQFIEDFMYTMATGILPDGTQTTNTRIRSEDLEYYWNRRSLPNNLPAAGSSRCATKPNDYFMTRFGGQGHREPMVLCEKNLNQVKGRVFNINTQGARPVRPISDDRFRALLSRAVTSIGAQAELLENLRQVIGVFRYINHPQALPIIRRNIDSLRDAAGEIGSHISAFGNMRPLFDEFVPNYYRHVANTARTWLSARLYDFRARVLAEIASGTSVPNNVQLLQQIQDLLNDLSYIVSPF